MSLRDHVRANDWSSFEDAWTELMLGAGPVGPVLDALAVLGKRKEVARAVHLVREHAELLSNEGRHADAVAVLGTALLQGGSPGELGPPLLAAASAAWSAEPWWPSFIELTGFREGTTDIRRAWRALHKLSSLAVGSAVYHASGWGIGRVEALSLDAGEIEVRFASGRSDRFPLASALEIFDVLDPGDLRALLVSNQAELARVLRTQPVEVLRDVLRRYENRVTYANLRAALAQLGVDGAAFTAWWRRARKEAEGSEWFEISGTGTKVVVRLLADAADPADALRRQLRLSRGLGDALKRARDLLASGGMADDLRHAALSTLEELAGDGDHPFVERLSSYLFLREHSGQTPAPLRVELERRAAEAPPENPGQAPALWQLFQMLPTLREHEQAIELLPEVFGGDWLEAAATGFPHAAPGMARPLAERLLEAGYGERLAAHYRTLLARPTRNPQALVVLADLAESGAIGGDFPPASQRAESLLRLAGHLKANAPGDLNLGRAKSRLTTLLSGRRGLLARLLAGADRPTLQNLRLLVERGVDDAVERTFTDAAIDAVPDFYRSERPFWESEDLWTTRRGLERRERELRELKEVKIPENAEAIGRAASFGDLSENSEWEAAIEEQRTLTSRAAEIEAEVRRARLLENASLPEGTVCPGTRVRYRDLSTRAEHSIAVVGPWDTDEYPDAISYRAPLAEGLLGLQPRQRGTVHLPTGEVDVEVLAVELLDL